MTDVEKLLRETLTDPRHRLEPSPGMYDTVRERARERRQRAVRVASAFALVVVIAGVATAIGVNSGQRRVGQVVAPPSITPSATPSITPSVTPSPPLGQATPLLVPQGSTTSVAVGSSEIFVAATQPNQLVEVSTADHSVTRRVATPDPVDGVAADAGTGRVWTWSSSQTTASGTSDGTNSTTINEYATSTLAVEGLVGGMPLSTYAFSGAALDGQLWLATSDGLYVVGADKPGGMGAVKVVNGSVFSVAADAVRHRILYGVNVSTPTTDAAGMGTLAVHEIDAHTHALIAVGTPLPIGKESIAIVGDQIWVAGYGSGSTPRLFHLDGASLQPLKTTGFGAASGAALGPGAIVWPGASVLWVRSGGSEALSCVDPQTGSSSGAMGNRARPRGVREGSGLLRQRWIARPAQPDRGLHRLTHRQHGLTHHLWRWYATLPRRNCGPQARSGTARRAAWPAPPVVATAMRSGSATSGSWSWPTSSTHWEVGRTPSYWRCTSGIARTRPSGWRRWPHQAGSRACWSAVTPGCLPTATSAPG